MVAAKAARMAATRSAGTPGGMKNGRPIAGTRQRNSKISRCLAFVARSCSMRTFGSSGDLRRPNCSMTMALPVAIQSLVIFSDVQLTTRPPTSSCSMAASSSFEPG